MKSLRGQLLNAFLLVIFILSLTTVVLFVLNLRVTQQYKTSSDVMVAEYQLLESGQKMSEAFNTIMQSLGTHVHETDKQIIELENNIEIQKTFLEQNIVDTQSKSNYLGFEASIDDFISLVNDSLDRFHNGRIDTYNDDYNRATKQFEFVRENGNTLLHGELSYVASLREQMSASYRDTIIFAAVLLLVFMSGCIFYVLQFSRKLIIPLQNLTVAAKELAAGNSKVTIQKEILQLENETGELANSFSIMAISLQDKVAKLNQSNEAISKSVKNFETKNAELVKLNQFMVDREIKMIELKEEIKSLKNRLSNQDL